MAGENWKLYAYREFDRTSNKAKEPYRIVAGRMLDKPPELITTDERQKGKAGDLACGFGGSVGAWRRISGDVVRTDAEILADVHAWRQAHPKTTTFWRELARAIRVAIRTGQPIALGNAITADFAAGNLMLTLPSGRRLTYPQARLVPNRKFEDGDPDVEFMDNARGKWAPYRGWFGTFAENIAQAVARDILGVTLLRLEARGIPVCLHVHDEIVVEIRVGSITEEEFLAIVLEAPDWPKACRSPGRCGPGNATSSRPRTRPRQTDRSRRRSRRPRSRRSSPTPASTPSSSANRARTIIRNRAKWNRTSTSSNTTCKRCRCATSSPNL